MSDRIRRQVVKLLNWSQLHTRTDMRYIAKGGFWLGTGHGVTTIISIGMALILGNLVSPSNYGVYKYILALAGAAGALSLSGLAISISRAVARGDHDALKRGFRTSLIWSTPTIVIACSISAYYFLNGNLTYSLGVLIAGLSAPLLNASNLYGAYLEGIKDFRRMSYYGMWYSIVPALMLIGAALVAPTPLSLIATYSFSYALLAWILYRRTLAIHRQDISRQEKGVTSYGFHVSAQNVLNTLAEHLDKILIFQFMGAAEVAIYTFAFAPIQQMQSVRKIFRSLMFPKLSTMSLVEIRLNIARRALLLFSLGAFLAIAYIVAAPYLFAVALPQYILSVPYSQALALITLLFPLTIYRQTFYAHARVRELYIFRTSHAISRIALLLVLVPMYGIWGVVGATLGGAMFEAVLLLVLFRRLS